MGHQANDAFFADIGSSKMVSVVHPGNMSQDKGMMMSPGATLESHLQGDQSVMTQSQ